MDRLPLEDPQARAPFPSPPPRNVFPAIGDPDLRPIAASFAAMLRVLSPSGRNHEREPSEDATPPSGGPRRTSSVHPAEQRAERGRVASQHGQHRPPPLPPRPWLNEHPQASTSRSSIAVPSPPDRPHRYTWSPGAEAPESQSPSPHRAFRAAMNDAPSDAGLFFGGESMQSIVNRGLGRPDRPLMPVAAAEEARLRSELAAEGARRPSGAKSDRLGTRATLVNERRGRGWFGTFGRKRSRSE